MDEQLSELFRRISKYIFIGVFAVLVLLLLLSLLRVSIGFWLWSTVETWATVRLGLDSDAAQLVTVILVSLITLLMPMLAWYFLWGKKQLWATGAVVGGQILIFLLVSTIGSGVCFDRQTGKPLCWYADIPSKGRVFSRTEGFDPETGLKYQLYTQEIALKSRQAVVIPSQPVTRTETTPPPISTETKTITVDAKKMWTDTGINLANGAEITIRASGQWTNGGDRPLWRGANGNPGGAYPGTISPSANLASLVAKVGSDIFQAGESYSGRSPTSGRLYLGMNDTPNGYGDNDGQLSVQVTYKSR